MILHLLREKISKKLPLPLKIEHIDTLPLEIFLPYSANWTERISSVHLPLGDLPPFKPLNDTQAKNTEMVYTGWTLI